MYTLSHSVHFSHRCLYLLLWKPGESLGVTMQRVCPWLEALCMHVPDAMVVMVASHCKTNISDDAFLELSRQVEAAAQAKVQDLNNITRLEVERLRTLLAAAEQETLRLEADYADHASSTPELAQADAGFTQQCVHAAGCAKFVAARASAVGLLPRSLVVRASDVHQAFVREGLLCERLQRLLGIRDGALPDDRDACQLSLHCKSVDSVEGFGVAELKGWIYNHCRSLPFMGEMISTNWTAVSDVFKHLGDSVLSRSDAVALVRQHLPHIPRLKSMCDDSIWNIIEFWSLVGRIFVYESQVVRDPSTLIALLKPLVHHEPLQMMLRHSDMIAPGSLLSAASRDELQGLLRSLQLSDELPLELLDHLKAWRDLSQEQRSSMLAFFERSRLLCCVNQRSDMRLITSRVRSKPHLSSDVEGVTARSTYHALYLLPLNHIGIIAHLQSTVFGLSAHAVCLHSQSGCDSLVVHRVDDPACCWAFSVEPFASGVERCDRFNSLCGLIGESFSYVLRIASTDFGVFKFASSCADAAMDSGSFGTRFQCWVAVSPGGLPPAAAISRADWTLFRARPRSGGPSLLCSLPLGRALRRNHHEHVVTGQNLMRVFKPRSSFFVSHSWGDGTGEFIARLKAHVEQQTLANVWVDMEGLNQQQEKIIPAFREALCQARVVIVVLTPSYLTRPNCLRELRWALDFERAGHLRVVLLSMHPAVTFDARQQLVQNGPLQGLVFSSKEKKVKRVCPEALALVKRLNDVHMNTLPWHELQAWSSDEKKGDWEEQRRYVQGGTDKTVSLAGSSEGLVEQTVDVVKEWLVCAAPRPVSECAAMDDTDVLLATYVTDDDDVCSVLDLAQNFFARYPEEAAATLKGETEAAMQQKEEAEKKAEEEEARQRHVAAAAAAARIFRRRCLQAAAAACLVLLFLLLRRAGRLPLRLRRLLAALLFWFGRR